MKCFAITVVFLLCFQILIEARKERRKDVSGRKIFGGYETTIKNFPYQVQIVRIPQWEIKYSVFSSCGGSIIADNLVITAGHCMRKGKMEPRQYLVRSGTSYRNGTGGLVHRVADIMYHEKYALVSRRQHSTNDVAILVVDPPFTFDQYRQKIPLAATPAVQNDVAIASGFGFKDLRVTVKSPVLQHVNLRIIDRDTCNTKTKWAGRIEYGNLCAGKHGDSGSCKGDSGGPLAVNGRLVGVVSWGYGRACTKVGYPSVFTNVTAYLPWIKSMTRDTDVSFE